MQTVFHHARREQAEAILANVRNLLDDDSVDVERAALVANADAVHTLTADAQWAGTVQDLAEDGVRFVACANSMRSRDIDESRLAADVETAPAGVGELTRLQDAGYAYVKD
jgi:intracellular sulfur oxidation DsrE/DsrF family protein